MLWIRFLVALLLLTAFAQEAQACGLTACLKRLFSSEAEQDVVTIVVPPRQGPGVQGTEVELQAARPHAWGSTQMERFFHDAYPGVGDLDLSGRRAALESWLRDLGSTTGTDDRSYEFSTPSHPRYGIKADYAAATGTLSIVLDLPPVNSTGYHDLAQKSGLPFDDTHQGLLLRAFYALGTDRRVARIRFELSDTNASDFGAFRLGMIGGRIAAANGMPSGRFINRRYHLFATEVTGAEADSVRTVIFTPHVAMGPDLALTLPPQPELRRVRGISQLPSNINEFDNAYEDPQDRKSEPSENCDEEEKEEILKESSTHF